MEPVFVDLHIHTSDNPNDLNQSYDLDLLKKKVEETAEGSAYLISLTDHDTVNKAAYLRAVQMFEHVLLGAELHVHNYDGQKPYHCHIYFKLPEINASSIDDINKILDKLYPNKVVTAGVDIIPRLEEIVKDFDAYEFVLLPHAGQRHSAFHMSIPDDVQFDNTLQRNIYYNLFDGFTSRSNAGLETTHEYFECLGINEFVNLVTSSDNYSPQKYPDAKSPDASPFLRTWMLASPTFNGLRLSLSESSRLSYGDKPDSWAEYIQRVRLKNSMIDIDVTLTPGLNVVIGGSSSGKTLFVDSVNRQITGDFEGSDYLETYSVRDIEVINPAGQTPHFLAQNYIMKVCDLKDNENKIDNITILNNLFPADTEERKEIDNGLSELSSQLALLVEAVKEIDSLHKSLKRLQHLSHLIVREVIQANPLKLIQPDDKAIELIRYGKGDRDSDVKILNKIDDFLSRNPLVEHDSKLVEELKKELELAFDHAKFERKIRDTIDEHVKKIDIAQETVNQEVTTKRKQFEDLLTYIRSYVKYDKQFYNSLEAISKFAINIETKKIESMGHKLFIDNAFEITTLKFLEVVNGMLKPENAIKKFDLIQPEALFSEKFRKRAPKVADYDDFKHRVNQAFVGMNKKKYRITTKEGKDFDKLSAGWKTSVILDLILGWSSDTAPLIIDQPEDNLATGYINDGLLAAIKACKTKKQIILVSHNATIPMLGDAQNVVMCRNDGNSITIRSNPLEGTIDGVDVVDLIAETTDGGKSSVKKRVKKYNLKSFRGPNETRIQKK